MGKRNMNHAPTCSVVGCERPYLAKGFCQLHYRRWNATGRPGPANLTRVRGRLCSVDGCQRKHTANGLCSMHLQRKKKTGCVGSAEKMIGRCPGCVTRQGYRIFRRAGHPNAFKDGQILEHTFVMSQVLGRSLRKGESVHHKNGDRLDNRPENLELWERSQPAGQRAADKIAYAAELLCRYSADESLWPVEWDWLRASINITQRRAS